jgi:hypothetical protein
MLRQWAGYIFFFQDREIDDYCAVVIRKKYTFFVPHHFCLCQVLEDRFFAHIFVHHVSDLFFLEHAGGNMETSIFVFWIFFLISYLGDK